MSISTLKNKNIYLGNGTTTTFPITFPFTNSDEIEVYLTDTNKTTTLLTSDYVVDVNNNQVLYLVSQEINLGSPLGHINIFYWCGEISLLTHFALLSFLLFSIKYPFAKE